MEVKQELEILRRTILKSNSVNLKFLLYQRINELELEIKSQVKKNLLQRNSIIKEKVNLDKSKNIFGVHLKKIDNKFLKEAREQEKK